MKCMMCENLSLTHICSSCQETFLTPSLYKRRLPNNIEVISFYKYSEIKSLLHSKHTDIGFYIYKILAQKSFAKFASEFTLDETIVSVGIDDNIKDGYSHTALLNRALKSISIQPRYNILRANNHITYSGKSREFRFMNLRDFKVKKFKEKSIILVDDIITTGSTLTQAIEVMHEQNKEVLFCLTLCDVNIK